MEKAVVIADTGFVVALLNRFDIKHTDVAAYQQQLKTLLQLNA